MEDILQMVTLEGSELRFRLKLLYVNDSDMEYYCVVVISGGKKCEMANEQMEEFSDKTLAIDYYEQQVVRALEYCVYGEYVGRNLTLTYVN